MRSVTIFAALLVTVTACAAPQSFTVDGVRLSYFVEGQGDPVVLLHGLGSSANLNWRASGTVRSLSQHYRVIALDFPGHGRSDSPSNASAYGVAMVNDVVRLLDHLHIRRAHIVGYSMGGMVALKLAVLHPDRVHSVLLGGMGWMPEGALTQKFWSTRDDVAARSLAALAITTEEMKALRVPVEVVIGERDPVRGMYVAPLHDVRPDIPIRVVPDAGHLNAMNKPAFQRALREWISAR